MDLLTPAAKWAAAEKSNDAHPESGTAPAQDRHVPHRMTRAQEVAMLLSVTVPIIGLIVAIIVLWQRGPASVSWPQIVAMVGMYAIAGFGVTIGYHRLLTHRAFESPRAMRLMFAIFGSMAAQGAVIRWCATHRRHHQTSDHDGDPHSPHLYGEGTLALLRGMFHSHMGWVFHRDADDMARSVPDLLGDRALLIIDRLYWLWVIIGLLIPGAIVGLWLGTWQGALSGMLWGGLVRICLMQHVTWSINSVCHVWGRRPFHTADHSANNWMCAVLALGEGWHNNHHAFPTSARHGLKWWQFDSSWLIIKALAAVGLARGVRLPTQNAIESKRIQADQSP